MPSLRPDDEVSFAKPRPIGYVLGQPRVGVFDTDYLMNEVAARVLGQGPRLPFSSLFRHAFIPRHVLDELYRPDSYGHRHKWDKLSSQAADLHRLVIPPAAFQNVFEASYLPYLRVVDMGDLYTDEPEVGRVRLSGGGRGASDVPTAQLAVLLSRLHPIVFAHDKHLRRPRVAPRTELLRAARGAEGVVQLGEGTVMSLTAGLGGGGYLLDQAVTRFGAAFGVGPWWSRVMLGALGAWLLADRERRAWIGQHAAPVLDFVGSQLENAGEALNILAAAAAPIAPRGDLPARMAEVFVRVLARRGPVLARDVQDALVLHEDDSELLSEIRMALQSQPCFVEGPRHHYSLGRRAIAPQVDC